jgi:hypothetical protein
MAKQNPRTGSSLVRLARTNPQQFAKRMSEMRSEAIQKGIRTPQSYQPKAPRRQLGFAAGPRTRQALNRKAGIKAFRSTTDASELQKAGVSPLVAKGILRRAQKQGKLDKFATVTKLPKNQGGGVVKKLNLQAVKNEQERFRKISAKGKQKLIKTHGKIVEKKQKQAEKQAKQAQKQISSNVQKAGIKTGAQVATGAYIAGKAIRALSSVPGMLRRGGNYRF